MNSIFGAGDLTQDGNQDLLSRDSAANRGSIRVTGAAGYHPSADEGPGWSGPDLIAGDGDCRSASGYNPTGTPRLIS
jgi:hypothetical protein